MDRAAFDRYFLEQREAHQARCGVAGVDVARLEQIERLVIDHYWAHDPADGVAARAMISQQLVPLMNAAELADWQAGRHHEIFTALARYTADIKDVVVRCREAAAQNQDQHDQ